MSDVLLLTLGLLAGVVGCLAKPCGPASWACIKAPRLQLQSLPVSAAPPLDEPAAEPGFADGLVEPVPA